MTPDVTLRGRRPAVRFALLLALLAAAVLLVALVPPATALAGRSWNCGAPQKV